MSIGGFKVGSVILLQIKGQALSIINPRGGIPNEKGGNAHKKI